MFAMWWFFLLAVRMVVCLAVGRRVVAFGSISREAQNELAADYAVDDRGVLFRYLELVA
jgi:hypothetical protein